MSNQMIINFAKKHIYDLRQELSDWERILEVYSKAVENEEMCCEPNNSINIINPYNTLNVCLYTQLNLNE